MLPSAHSYENTFNTTFFWGAGQNLRKSLTSKCLRSFVYDHTISSRMSKQQVERQEYSGIPISRTLGFPNLLISRTNPFFHWLNLLYSSSVISPPISRTRDFSKLPIWLPCDKLTTSNSNLRKFPNHLVRMSITITTLRWLYILFFKGLNITCS